MTIFLSSQSLRQRKSHCLHEYGSHGSLTGWVKDNDIIQQLRYFLLQCWEGDFSSLFQGTEKLNHLMSESLAFWNYVLKKKEEGGRIGEINLSRKC